MARNRFVVVVTDDNNDEFIQTSPVQHVGNSEEGFAVFALWTSDLQMFDEHCHSNSVNWHIVKY